MEMPPLNLNQPFPRNFPRTNQRLSQYFNKFGGAQLLVLHVAYQTFLSASFFERIISLIGKPIIPVIPTSPKLLKATASCNQ